jgi:hypothetical protein
MQSCGQIGGLMRRENGAVVYIRYEYLNKKARTFCGIGKWSAGYI